MKKTTLIKNQVHLARLNEAVINAAQSQSPEKLHKTVSSGKPGVQSLEDAIRAVACKRGVKYEPVNVRAIAAKSIRGMSRDGKYNINKIRITPSAGMMEHLPKPNLDDEREGELLKAHDIDGMKKRIAGIMLGFTKDKVSGVCSLKSLRQSILDAGANMTKAVNALTNETLFQTLNSTDPEERIWGMRKLYEVFELAGEEYEQKALEFIDSLDFATLKKMAESSEEYSKEMGGLWNSNRNALADPSNMFASFVLLNFCPVFALVLLIPMLMPLFASWYSGKRAENLKIDMNDEEALRAEAKASVTVGRISGNAVMAHTIPMSACEVAPSELQNEMEKFHNEASPALEKMRERLTKAFLEAGRSAADGKTVTAKGAADLGLTNALEEVSLEAAKLAVGANGDVDENGLCEPGRKYAEMMGAIREVATTYSEMEMFEVDDEDTSKSRMKLNEEYLEKMNKKDGFYSALASDILADAKNYLENQNLVSSVADYAEQYALDEGRSGVVGETMLEMLRLRKLDAMDESFVNENSAYHYSRYGFTRASNGIRVGKQVDVKSSTIFSAVKCLSKYTKPETLAAFEEVLERMEKKKEEGQMKAEAFILAECDVTGDCVSSVVTSAKNKNPDLDEDILKQEVLKVFGIINRKCAQTPSFKTIEDSLNEPMLEMKKRSVNSPVRGFIADMSMRIVPQEAWGSLCVIDENFLGANRRLNKNKDLPPSLRFEIKESEEGFSVREVVEACEKMHEARKSLIVAAVLSRQLEVEMAARVARGEDVPSTAERLVASALAAHVSNACRMEREAAPALEKFDKLPKKERNTPAFKHLSSFVFAAHADLDTRKKSLGERLGDFGRVLDTDVVKTLSAAGVADEALLFKKERAEVAEEMSKKTLAMEKDLVKDLTGNLAKMDEKWTREFVSTSVSWCNATSMSGLLEKLVGYHVDAEVSSMSTSGLETRAVEPEVPEPGDEGNEQAWWWPAL